MKHLISISCIIIFLIFAGTAPQGSLEQNLNPDTDSLPRILPENKADLVDSRLRNEAVIRFASHQLPSNIKDWEVYRTRLKDEIIRKTGVDIDHNLPVDMKETAHMQMSGYSIKNIYFQTRPGIYATANLYIPEGKGPFPGVIVMCGHSSNGRLYDNYQAVGHSLALNGYVALAIDPWGAGERTTKHGAFEYHGANLGASLMNIGETLMGMQITDNMRGVDLLYSLPYVDRRNIGATGASGGGNQTMWLAAVDDRIKAAVPVVSVGSFESYVMRSNCVCELLVDGLSFTEEAGVLALAEAIMPCNHEKDSNPAFFPSEMLRTYHNAKPVFELKGAGDNISYRTFDLTHGYHPENRRATLGWFDLKLKGIGNGDLKEEVPFELVTADKLMTFSAGMRDKKVMNTEEYCKIRGNDLRKNYLNTKTFNLAQKKDELIKVLRINEKSDLKKVHRYSVINGWDRFALETSDGKIIPVLHKTPSDRPSGYVVLTDPAGKNNISPEYINEILKKGMGLVIADLSGTGEASSSKEVLTRQGFSLHTQSRAELWLGKTVLGEWVKELNVVTEFIKSDLKAQKIILDGSKESGLAGMFLGVISENVNDIVLRDAPVSYLFDNRENIDYFSMGIHLPGFLNWGDISLAAALTGKNISFIRPLTMSGQPVSGAELNRYKTEFETINKTCRQPGKTIFVSL